MAINFSAGDVVEANVNFINSDGLPGAPASTKQNLGKMGNAGHEVLATGQTVDETLSFITIMINEVSRNLYFADDEQLNNALDLAQTSSSSNSEVSIIVKNVSGGPLLKFTPVTLAGYNSNEDVPLVRLAVADNSAFSAVLGLASQDIADGATGSVIISGIVQGINTSQSSGGSTLAYLTDFGTLDFENNPGSITSIVGRILVKGNSGSIYVIGPNTSGGNYQY